MFDLAHKRILITGASAGIGEALAYACARRGAELILVARTLSALKKVREQCQSPEKHHIEALDLGEIETLEHKAQALWDTYGPIDILVNNAGISQRYLFTESCLSVDQKIMNVNFFGTVALTRPLVRRMLARGTGHIVCVSSILGLIGKDKRTAYSASKHALRGYFESLRQELWTSPVHITMIYPGYIDTSLAERALLADGKPQGAASRIHAKGLKADTCASRILYAILAKKDEVVIGSATECLAMWIARLAPALFRRLLRRFAP